MSLGGWRDRCGFGGQARNVGRGGLTSVIYFVSPAPDQAGYGGQAAHVIREGLDPAFNFGAHRSNRAHQRAARFVGVRAEDVFGADAKSGAVAVIGPPGQRCAALAFVVRGFVHAV
jgi:hypothetical protein